MRSDSTDLLGLAELPGADRIGMARLAKLAFDGADLRPMQAELVGKLLDGSADAGEGMDLSLIMQLLGDKQGGLGIQQDVLKHHQLYRSPCATTNPQLRVLALAAATDIGSNTPIEFLLEESGIELMMLYVIPEVELPVPLPRHDIAIVIASDSEDCREALRKIDAAMPRWPRPLLNPPKLVCNLDRDKLYRLLQGIEGLAIPPTFPVARQQLSAASRQASALVDIASDLIFPVIVRPQGSHAGVGLGMIKDEEAMARYLGQRHEENFFVSPFVDYSSEDGSFRKYRIAFVDGQPYPCHMAIADRWDIWYLNAGMTGSASKRLEEQTFMQTFDIGFARRHRTALAAMAGRIDLDYFTADCAETKSGSLLIFEADNTAVVHNMDSPDLFPYKPPQMQKIFNAFVRMVEQRVGHSRERVA